jgi:hypothetical protein
MMLAAVIALKAYSIHAGQSLSMQTGSTSSFVIGIPHQDSATASRGKQHTDLVQATIVGKNGNVSVVGSGCKCTG